jgi:thioesterase domain-containing protein
VAAPVKLFIAEELPLRGVRLEQRASGWGWQALTTRGVDVFQVPGNHLNMLNDPQVAVVAERLRACLD